MGLRPVFLHGMWRSGSTFVWSRFRAAEGTLCFYEPLQNGLGRLNRRRLGSAPTPDMRHPEIGAPYFAEFEPLLGLRGVRGYRQRFAYDRFALEPGEHDPALARYLDGLVAEAERQSRHAVLGFNGAELRIGWMRRRYGACDIAIDRDPYAVWASYAEHLQRGNATFLVNWLRIVERNAAHPAFAPLAARLPLRRGAERWGKAKRFYARALQGMAPGETYLMVCYLWIGYALHALSNCDLVVDLNRVDEAAYRRELEGRIGEETGLSVDLSQARQAKAAVEPAAMDPAAVEAQAVGLFPLAAFRPWLDAERVAARLGELTPRKAGLLRAVLLRASPPAAP